MKLNRILDGDGHVIEVDATYERIDPQYRERRLITQFVERIEKAAVFRSLENLMTFPFVRKAVERGEVHLHGAYFGVAEGSLFVLDQAAKEFRSAREGE